jgi:hypothetical protein
MQLAEWTGAIGDLALKRQGNRIIPAEQQVRLAKRPNGAQEQSASILDLLSFIGSGISYLSGIFIMRLPWLKQRVAKSGGTRYLTREIRVGQNRSLKRSRV